MRQLLRLSAKEISYRMSLFRNIFFAMRQPLHLLAKEKCYRISLFRNFLFAMRQLLRLSAKEKCYRINSFEISSSPCGSFYTFLQRRIATASPFFQLFILISYSVSVWMPMTRQALPS